MKSKEILIAPPFIKLDALLKFCGACQTGGEAKNVILDGLVRVNGEPCVQRSKKIKGGDRVEFDGVLYEVLERGD